MLQKTNEFLYKPNQNLLQNTYHTIFSGVADRISFNLGVNIYIYIIIYIQGVPEFFEQNVTKCSLQLSILNSIKACPKVFSLKVS